MKINRTKMILRGVMKMTMMNMKFYQDAIASKEPGEGSRRRWRGYSRRDLRIQLRGQRRIDLGN